MSDLISNHFEHENLVKTCKHCSTEETRLFVSFSHHRPRVKDKDLNFFKIAEPYFTYEKILEEKYPVMFENDPGDAEIRATVHVYEMKLKSSN